VIFLPKSIAIPLIALASTIVAAQSVAAQTQFNRNLIFLDPAHGGPDTGAQLPNHILEKDVTLAFNAKLRVALAAASFTVISPRDADPAEVIPTDQRAGLANHARPLACLLLHATASGSGIHIFTSALSPDPNQDPADTIPWGSAQAASIPQSVALANLVGLRLQSQKLPVILTRGSVPPLDNLTCPAIALEIAPLSANTAAAPVTDDLYQQHIAQAIVAALQAWRTQAALAHPPATGNTGATQ
jgi:N-acetylmuramoyl-L-alanine amidase